MPGTARAHGADVSVVPRATAHGGYNRKASWAGGKGESETLIYINSEFVIVRPDTYYGGCHEGGVYEYLYRWPDERWFLHTVNEASLAEPTFAEISEEEAVGWLIRSCRAEEQLMADDPRRGDLRLVPPELVAREEEYLCGSRELSCPPPIGQHIVKEIPQTSRTWDAVMKRRSLFLEPGRVLQNVLWPATEDVARTKDFREQRHDPLLTRLQEILEARLLERPRMSMLQSLQDRGVDLLVEWPHRGKYGVQLKSNGDVEEKDFAAHTLMQIQDSRQHGLQQLYVVIAADIREVRKGKTLDNANAQKVRGLISRISAMNDPYVVVVPPERAWTLLFGT